MLLLLKTKTLTLNYTTTDYNIKQKVFQIRISFVVFVSLHAVTAVSGTRAQLVSRAAKIILQKLLREEECNAFSSSTLCNIYVGQSYLRGIAFNEFKLCTCFEIGGSSLF